MKKIISLILSVTMLASAAQLYASADIAPDVVQTEAVQEATAQSTTQSTTQKTTETTQSSDSGSNTDIAASGSASAYTSDESSLSTESAKIKTAVNALLKSETADEEQSGKLTLANSPMLKAQQAINLTQATDLGDTFYAAIKFRDTSAYLGVDFSSYTEHNYGDAFAESYNVVIRSNPTDQSYYWKFTSTGDGDGSYYIENILNNWRLDVNEGKSAIYTNVQLWSVANTDNSQKWKIYKDTQGRYVFTSRVTDEKTIDARVLDIAGNGWADDTNAQIYFYDPTSEADRFYLEMMSVAAQEESCKPITSDNINFQLFDYSEGINRNGGIKGINEGSTDTNNWRPLANYFSFVANPAEKLTTDPKPDAWVDNRGEYDADGFVLNHATVERKLVNNYPVIDLSRSAVSNTGDSGKKGNGDNSELPDKDDRSLAYLFGGEPDNRAVQSYSPKNTILQEYTDTNSGVKHYYYNSTVSISGTATQDLANAVDYDYNANEFRVRSYTEGGGFFPFNTTSDQGVDNSPHAFSNPDHWFGMRMDVDFIQGEGGKINGEDMIFNFTGDDDIWVFIDDVLVLDIGGRHTAVRGSINFSSGEIKAYNPAYADVCNYPTTLSKVFELAGANPIGGWSSDKKTFANYTSHKLSFFYLERAKGEATCCIDFNLPEPPTNSVQISKTVEDKNGNAVTTDNNDYTFRLCYANSDDVISDSQLLSYEKIDSNGNRVTGNLDYGEFSLKNGEWIRFTSLGDECKIKEINNPIYVKKTDVKVEGVKTAEFENVPNNTPYISVQPSATNEKTVEFINTLQSVDINFKFYNRDPATGKTADVSSTPQTFTRTVSNNEYGTLYNSNPKTDNKETYFSNIISTVGVDFSTKYSNVLDNYELFQSQSQALSTITTFKDYHSENGSNYSSQAYHTNRYGYTQSKVGEDTYIWNDPENTTADGAKWVTYKDGNGNEIAEENLSEANAGSVETIDVWLFNNPRYYYVSVYGATESSQLTTVGTKHIATANSTPYNAFYNQRFGTAIDNGGYIDSATDYLKAYGISGYIGQSVSTASAIGDLKFSYWSFDENGKTVASTDRRYNFRIKNNLTLYAVYETTPLSEKKDDSGNIVKGLSVSMNDPDLYVENGKERIRLNTEINPYNCPDQDTNIQNVAAIYVVDKYANIVMDDTVLSCIKKIVQQNIADIKQESNGSSHTGIDLSTLTGDDVIKDCDGHTLTLGKGNFYVYYVDAFVKPVDGVSNQVVLTNKNRAEFLISFAKDTLKNKRLFTFGAMLYGENIDSAGWIVSDNCVDYAFNENGEAYDPSETVVITDLAKRFEHIEELVFNPDYYLSKYPELEGKNNKELYEHFINYGVKNGDQAHPCFDVKYYLANNEELQAAYGKNNYIAAFNHYVSCELYDNKTVKTAEPANLGDYFTANITSVAFEKYLAPDNGEVKAVAKDAESNVQKWRFARQSDGSYIIVNAETGYYLNSNPDGASNPNSVYGKAVTAVDKTDTVYKRWYIYEYGYGEYIIKSASSNILVIDVDITSGEKVQTWENNYNPQQRFRFENKKELELAENFEENSYYTIKVGNNYLAPPTDDALNLTTDESAAARWKFKLVKTTYGNYYNIICNDSSAKPYLDLDNGNITDGHKIHLWTGPSYAQKWQIWRNKETDKYYIKYVKSESNTVEDTPLTLIANSALEAGGGKSTYSNVYLNTFDPDSQYQQITITKISTEG